ncbi:MAG: B12-binding domain-containing radical SAM protein [Rhodospirillaceae bacterium]|jgi:radical SAM superfamily enzyme YgiQ (UPF0313 family)|nr:B12-binding domain-containing radical SAM protein [Rhodospirillales bacterium]MBT3906161.1 B12-binding domain-containing radical SAM protein [Rhodospirillaceae bacterium]MBT4702468.1 B12-binding domain-containing radical SAM protein [Rhodospirillaceae bacterium]MBT5034813.1 B12-binding domain-containing radical SAM protein [Rhodospirillaceae bacterium]MBT6218534.1 B12-binding domain-containing radical SAM protein [Rhodospirillaceae bacterium]
MTGENSTANKKTFVTFVRGPIVYTKTAINNEATPAIAFAYLSAYIKNKGYDFTFVDGVAEGLNRVWPMETISSHVCQGLKFEEIIERIPANTDVIAFSAMFSGEWPAAKLLLMAIRKAFPDVTIVAGGEHVTALSEYCLKDCPAINVCVRGEGEHTFYELLECIENGQGFDEVNGVSFLDGQGNYVENTGQNRIREVDAIPWPYWPDGYLEKFWATGKSFGVMTERDMPMMISRGCPYQCTFCSNPGMWTTRYILRDIEDVIAELKTHIEKYDITAVQLYDLTAITKKRWIIEFGKRLAEEKISVKWSLPSGTRSEALDDDTLRVLRDINCNYLVYAPESGSKRTLERIKKRIDLDRLTGSIMSAVKIGIVTRANLMIGLPKESRIDIYRTLAYGLKLAWHGIDEVSMQLFCAYPGTELFRELVAEKRIVVSDSYFLSLTSIYGDYVSLNHLKTNQSVGPKELSFYRLICTMLYYLVGYTRFPKRIIRTYRNVKGGTEMTTVLEHRMHDALERRSARVNAK